MGTGIAAVTSHSLMNGLIAYYKCDEVAGSNVDDIYGGNDATLYDGAVTNATGKLNKAIDVVDSDSHMQPPLNLLNNKLYDQFTLSMWVKHDTLAGTLGYTAVYFNWTRIGGNSVLECYQDNTNNKICFLVRDASNNIKYVYSTAAITDTTNFVHIVCTVRGIGELMKLYINGDDVSVSSETLVSFLHPITDTENNGIGNVYRYGTNAIDGQIDEIGIWKRSLTENEIWQLYNGGMAYEYPFNN